MVMIEWHAAGVSGMASEHRFTFELWTVADPGRDPFGALTEIHRA